MQHRLCDDHSTRIISPGWFFHPGVKNPQSSVENPEPMFPGESGLIYGQIHVFFRQNRAQILITRGIRSEAQVHRSGHHAFLSGHRAFLSGAVFFSHNRIKKSQNTTLVCEIHGVRGENPFENLPAHPATAARSGTKFSTSPFTSSTPGHFRGGTASRKWIPIPRQKTRCSELFSAVLRKNAVS